MTSALLMNFNPSALIWKAYLSRPLIYSPTLFSTLLFNWYCWFSNQPIFKTSLLILKLPFIMSTRVITVLNTGTAFLFSWLKCMFNLGHAWLHGFTISVPVLILAVFWQLLLRNKKISSKSLFWKERTQHVDSRMTTGKLFHNHFN